MNEPEKSMWLWTTDPVDAPDTPEYITIEYKNGDPISINDELLTPAKLLKRLNEYGNKHGIGRLDIVENRYVGMKARGCYETPGGTIMLKAHRAIESIDIKSIINGTTQSGLVAHYNFEGSTEVEILADKAGGNNGTASDGFDVVGSVVESHTGGTPADTDLRANGTDLPDLSDANAITIASADDSHNSTIDSTDDHIIGTMSTDTVEALDGAQEVSTLDGNDIITTKGADTVLAGAGDDTIKISDTNFAFIHGGSGTDKLSLADSFTSGADLSLVNLSSKVKESFNITTPPATRVNIKKRLKISFDDKTKFPQRK